MNEAAAKTCEGCGNGITAEEIAGRQAGLVQGILLCPACVEKKRQEVVQQAQAAQASQPASAPAAAPPPAAHQAEASASPITVPQSGKGPVDVADIHIDLVSDEEMAGSASHQIRTFAAASTLGGAHHDENLKRPLAATSEPATRCRTFHAKLTDAGLAHMDDTMNDWLDSHPDVFVKSATSTVGNFEAKKKEEHLFITIFY